jgi:hypothetical protein
VWMCAPRGGAVACRVLRRRRIVGLDGGREARLGEKVDENRGRGGSGQFSFFTLDCSIGFWFQEHLLAPDRDQNTYSDPGIRIVPLSLYIYIL